VRGLRLPAFITDLFAERAAWQALLTGTIALVAAALDPQTWSPMLPSVQAAVRESSQLETVALLASLSAAGLILIGGVVGDTRKARPVLLAGLAVELVGALVGVVVTSGPLFVVARLTGHAGAAFVIPVSIALVATSYKGVTRATAIGVSYGAYGAALAAAPILLQVVPGAYWPGMLAAAAMAAVAILVVRRHPLELRHRTRAELPLVVGVAVWAFGIIVLTVGLVWVNTGLDNPFRWALIIGGPLLVIGYRAIARARAHGTAGVIQRGVAVALFVGVVIAISQTAAMLNLPMYFRLIMGYGPVLAVAALAPLFGALVLAGPVAGILIARVAPRWLVGGGVIVIGVGNLVLYAVTSPEASYLGFIVPCLVIGAGFAVATTVRTAIIFASAPEGLPATAAALNESSITVGNRIGIVLVSAIVGQVAMSAYASSVAALPPPDAAAATDTFRSLLTAVNTPSFTQIVASLGPVDVQPYREAYLAGLDAAFLACGVVAIIGGAISLLALGGRDPLVTTWEYREERVDTARTTAEPTPTSP
jgi:MFS family permease